MAYPIFRDKHLQEAVITPVAFVKYAYPQCTVDIPKKCVLAYQTSALNYFRRRYKPEAKIKLNPDLIIHRYNNVGFVRIAGIGSPNAVACLEELVALGGKTFLTIGNAGGLQHEGVFLCTKALKDEGTSYHYTRCGKYSFPDKKLTLKFGKYITKQGIELSKGSTWTIDAPYRETKAEIKHYAKKGISTVEMEASALFAVAQYRKAKIASAFVVGDLLTEKGWEPKFREIAKKRALNQLVDASISCLLGLSET